MIKVLVFAKDLAWHGGVVNFISQLKNNIDPAIYLHQFKIGQRRNALGKVFRPVTPLVDLIRLVLMLLVRKHDAYHVNPSFNFNSLIRDGLFLLVLRAFGKKNVIVTFHGWDSPVAENVANSRVKLWLFNAAYSWTRCIMVLAEEFRVWMIEHGVAAEKVGVFTTMFDGTEFKSSRKTAHNHGYVVLYLSRIVKEKGVFEAISAIEGLSKDFPDIKLVVAGTGPDEARAREFVRELGVEGAVEFLGYVRGEEKVDAFMAADLFLLPSYGEGCPVSMMEAMAAGLPIVTTPVGGIPAIIKQDVNGILLDSVTNETVADAIRKFLKDYEYGEKISNNNYKEAWEKYDARIITKIFERLYRGECIRSVCGSC